MRFLLLLVAFMGCSLILFSVTVYSAVSNLDGEFPFSEGNFLSSEIKPEFGNIDNFLRSDDNKQTTNFLKISPQLFIQTQGSGSLFQFQATANYFTFDEFSSDDHYDFSVLSKFHLRFAESQKIFLSGFIADDYEYRGTGLSLGEPNAIEEGDTRRNGFVNAGYLYGHQDSLARAKFLIGYRDFSYLTREQITNSLAYSSNYFQGDFDYLITGKTYFSTKVQYEDLSYDLNADLERKQYLALAGVKWESTELTQLHLLLGYEKAIFTNQIFKENDRFAWQVKLLWNPINRIRLDFTSGSEINDSYKIDQSISYSNYYDIGLDYDFNDELVFNVNSRIVNSDIIYEDSTIKEEHLEITIGVEYQWQHWLSAYTKYNYNTFNSTGLVHDYDLQAFSVGLVVTF